MSRSTINGTAQRPGRISSLGRRLVRLVGVGAPASAFATIALLVLTSGYAVGAGALHAPAMAQGHPASAGALAPSFSATGPTAPGVSGVKVPSFALPPASAASAPTPAAPLAPMSSGKGTFFTTTGLPNPAIGNNTCIKYGPSPYIYKNCYNDTNEPSINVTTKGVTAIAYTAFTNQSPCAGTVNNATTEVGFSTSSNLGSTWSTPTYLGNPVCTGYDGNFSSAMEPSLTSLANGTLVLSYVEYNTTPGTSYPYYYYSYAPPNIWCGILSHDRIVVTESYNSGSTWTTPTALSSVTNITGATCPVSGFPDLQPWVSAFGKTVYLSWMTIVDAGTYSVCPNYPIYGAPVSSVSFAASTNGGTSWSTVSSLPTIPGTMQYSCYTGSGYTYSTADAMNPTITTSPSGEVFLAYITGFNESDYPIYANASAELIVANSTNNGTTFTSHVVDNDTILKLSNCCAYPDEFVAPMPSLAYGRLNNQLYVAWGAGIYGNFCENYGTYSYCGDQTVQTVWVANSSTLAMTWSAPHLVSKTLVDPFIATGAPYNILYNPSIAVDAKGVLHLQASYVNDTLCYTYVTSSFCNGHQQIYTNSTDNGTTWSQPVFVYYAWTPFLYYGPYQDNEWAGQYSTMIAAGNQVILAWTTEQCPGGATGTYCYWGSAAAGFGEVMVSKRYTGTGLTLTIKEKGLVSGTAWSASIMGNYRAAAAPNSLSVSGVPPSQLVSYSVPWINQSWGIAYNDSIFPGSANSFTASSTIYANFTEKVKFTVTSIPTLPYYYWTSGYVNYNLAPSPASSWVGVGTTQYENITAKSFGIYCFPCLNLSFQSWTGSGLGNVTTLSNNISVLVNGPVNETATFFINGFCYSAYNFATATYTKTCLNNTYYPMDFVESGLPANVQWGATVIDQNGSRQTNQTTSKVDGFLAPSTPVQFYVWSVPDPSTGKVWVPTTDVTSPTMSPQSALIHVLYTLQTASSARFVDTFNESGLPAGSSWTLQLNSQTYGVESNNTTLTLAGGGPTSVNGSGVYQETGYGYYAASITVTQYTENATLATLTTPGKVTFNGSTLVTINYKPLFLVTTAASVGGTVTPATGWVKGGSSVQLNVSAAAGYHFVSWTGSGSGSTNAAQAGTKNPLITPSGPVTEFATFRPNPLPTWNLTINGVGLPTGTNFTVGLGLTSFAGAGSFKVGYIVSGSYALDVPYVYLNSSQTTRFVPTGIASSLAFDSSGLLNVSANGTLTVTFTTQYLFELSSTPSAGGSITPAAGSYWENAGAVLALTATPAHHYYFVGWNATSSAGIVSIANSVSLTLTAPVIENAQFAWRPVGPPATYWIQITANGLPKGLAWNVSLGSFGASGNSSTLTVNGLNGSYTLALPDLYVGAGTRYVSSDSGKPESVTGNSTASVNFTEQFLVTVTWSSGGSATPSSGWVAKGGSVQLTATAANASERFVNWTGNGASSYSGTNPSPTLTVNGPVSEVATFSPIFPQKTTTESPMGGQTLSFGLLAALLVVGLTVGILLTRRASRPPSAPPEEWTAPAEEGAAMPEYAETPAEEPES